ncbi:MAG: peroxiredoxin family protein [Bacteroidia bacterium]
MKKLLVLTLFMTFLGFMGAFAQAKKMPQFSFDDLKGGTFASTSLKAGLPTIVFFFDPFCDHCEQQAKWIAADAAKFKNVNLVWVSTEDVNAISKFKSTHFAKAGLDKLHFLKDSKYRFDGYFGYSEALSMYVFNKAGVQVKALKKETPAAELLKAAGL